ncbi:MAG: hypothetical protein J5I59_00735 [Saprospiraceae bacterium]|nr:hypothetical protein [Saprospiraceae bacterium]
MKYIYLLIICMLYSVASMAQNSSLKGMNYQAVARDQKGQVIANKKIELKIELNSLLSGKEVVYYDEIHDLVTNQLGLFSLVIGEGKPEKGKFDAVPWSKEDIFIKISIKDADTNEFVTVSNSKLQAVPYAYYAVTAGQLDDAGLDIREREDFWKLKGNDLSNNTEIKAVLGTMDCSDLVIVSNSLERMKVLCGGDVEIINNLSVDKNAEIKRDFFVYGNVELNSTALKNNYLYTVVNGKFTVANHQPTVLTGDLTVDENTWLKGTLRVDKSTNLNDSLSVNNGAPTYLSGSLTVDGYTWLKDRLRVDKSTNLNDSLSVNNGAPSYLSGSLTVDGYTWLKDRLRVDKSTNLNDSLSVNNGAPSYLSGSLTVDGYTWLKDRLRVDKSTNLNDSLSVNNGAPSFFTGTLEVDKDALFKEHVLLNNSALQSDSTGTGALVVAGGVGIGKNLYVGGEFHSKGPLKVESTLDVDGPANFYNYFTVHKLATFKEGIKVEGAANLDSALTVQGATVLNNTLNVTGLTTLGKLNTNGQVTIHAELTKGDGNYDNYPLRVEGSAQGIAIKLTDNTVNNDNNFVTFYNNTGGAVGAIEGQTAAEVAADPEYAFNLAILIATEVTAGVNVGLAAIPIIVGGLGVSTGPCGACLAMAAADLVLATANLAAFNAFAFSNLGVTYSSGSADYAEWLERSNPAERILPGEIVGVYGGKISKYTKGAQHLMVISTKPAILGNVPEAGTESLYEKVAFMGQIPVRVRGLVVIGDFILPSGLNDGIGVAVSPDDIKPEQYKEIVGVAWSNSYVMDGMNLINMAIGLNSNDMARLAEAQEKRITIMENKFNSLEKRIAALEAGKSIAQPETPTVELKGNDAQPNNLTREQMAFANMPPELDDQVMKDAMSYLKYQYDALGLDVKKHPGLYRLFTDEAFRQEMIKKTQANYKITYQKVMSDHRK